MCSSFTAQESIADQLDAFISGLWQAYLPVSQYPDGFGGEPTERAAAKLLFDARHTGTDAKTYTSKSLNSGLLLMTSRTNPHSGSTVRLRRRTS